MFSAIAALSTCAIAIASGDPNTCDEGTMLQVNLAKVRKHSSNETQRSHSDDTPEVAVLGCPGSHERKQPTGTANVYCCSIDGNQCHHPDDCQAHTDKTFAEAQDICSSEGLRLCTEDEIEARTCCGRGCNFAFYKVWTSPVQISQNVPESAPPRYEHLPGKFIWSNNIAIYDGEYTPKQCAEICDAEPRCMAFEYVPPYSTSCTPTCRLQRTAEEDFRRDSSRYRGYEDMDLYVKDTTPPGYEHLPGRFIWSNNIAIYDGEYTPKQCADICDAEPRCRAFEYVPPYSTSCTPTCRLQRTAEGDFRRDSSRYRGYEDMDLYVKN